MSRDESELDWMREIEARLDHDHEREPRRRQSRHEPLFPHSTPSEAIMLNDQLSRDRVRKAVAQPWIHPLPKICGVMPTILSIDRRCVDLGYREPVVLPPYLPVFAVQSGVIRYASRIAGKCTVTVDHPGGWSTHYDHLDHMFALSTDRFRRRKERVRTGDVIGYAGGLPRHVRFELWREDDGVSRAVDPRTHLSQWHVLRWAGDHGAPAQAIDQAA